MSDNLFVIVDGVGASAPTIHFSYSLNMLDLSNEISRFNGTGSSRRYRVFAWTQTDIVSEYFGTTRFAPRPKVLPNGGSGTP
ncbi:MAG: hypothetical protein ACI9BW_001566 [Gammaproteobacteria bacterium]|jgi:hypothetical protein